MEQAKKDIDDRMPLLDYKDITGEATVQSEFLIDVNKKDKVPVAGCLCTSGQLKKDLLFEVTRRGKVIHEGNHKKRRNISV